MANKLAIYGGKPVRESTIPISKPLLNEEEFNAVKKVLSSGWLVQGEEVLKFEEEFAKFIGTKFAVAMNSGTAALIVALDSMGIQPGDEVITSPLTFIASANSILSCGGIPVFCDVDLKTYNIDTSLLESLITKKTRAIMPVHLYGLPCNMPVVQEVANKHDLTIIEDAAQAHGASIKGKKIGNWGDVACFSFYATKNMTTGEGGMIVTNNEEIASRSISLRDQGQKLEGHKVIRYVHSLLGFNYRMTNINAAIGRVQLRKLPQYNQKRIKNAQILDSELRTITGLDAPYVPEGYKSVYHLYGARVESKKLGFTRDKLIDILRAEGIGARGPYPIPVYKQELYTQLHDPKIHRFSYFVKYPKYEEIVCPLTEQLTNQIIELPVHHALTSHDLDDMVMALEKIKSIRSA